MKGNKAADTWRGVYKRLYPTRLTELRFAGLKGIGSDTLSFHGGVTVICGANGVGKTTLLHAALACLEPGHHDLTAALLERFEGSRLEAKVVVAETEHARLATFDDDAVAPGEVVTVPVVLLNPAMRSFELVKLFRSVGDLAELVEQSGFRTADPTAVEELSYVVGKGYSECLSAELEELVERPKQGTDDDSGLELDSADIGQEVDETRERVVPYFRVTSGGATYGSESMGLGEMSLHLLLWHLNRVPENTILLIEEPEAYISPASQEALLNIIAHHSLRRGLWTIITTHSPAIVSRVPRDHIRLVSRVGDGTVITASPSPNQLALVFGYRLGKSGVLLVEDEAAADLARAWLGVAAPELLENLELTVVAGRTAIDRLRAAVPVLGTWFCLVGLYDGDSRSNTGPGAWPAAFLPGSVRPERLVRENILGRVEEVANQCRRSVSSVKHALGDLEGRDDHDWLHELSAALSLPADQLTAALFAAWSATSEANAREAEVAAEALVTAVQAARTRPLPREADVASG